MHIITSLYLQTILLSSNIFSVINHIFSGILYCEYKINNKNKTLSVWTGKTKYLIIQGV